ncbi:MAG: hypothetical protein EOP88_00670 [Verrucomicrobiaceae bacterium]|nr:MAG: hypothetical protein EOP88_00670 [Verrucomicrobiaceae bacterium]
MSKPARRTRITASKTAAGNITIRPISREKNGSVWVTHLVQGWQENGKWMRKQFSDRSEAETFAALKRVDVENKGRAQRMVLSSLTQDQHDEAVSAIAKLGTTYTLIEAVDYFLRHHRPPDFTIRASEALKLYLDDKERDGVRDRTLVAIKSVLNQFILVSNDPWIHEIPPSLVESYLRGLRAKNGKDKATKKTWNNYRNDLGGLFAWCCVSDPGTNRPFTFENPVVGVRKFSARQVREEQEAKPRTTSPGDVLRIFSTLLRWRGGVMTRYFAYLYFAGVRPDELRRISPREHELLSMKTRTLTIPANVAKTRQERQIRISDNFAAWLEATPGLIIPPNFDRLAKIVRKHFGLSHDEARHSFISYHVALHRSVGDVALQAGNSEGIVKRHYFNTHTQDEGGDFFKVSPDMNIRRAVLASRSVSEKSPHLRAF